MRAGANMIRFESPICLNLGIPRAWLTTRVDGTISVREVSLIPISILGQVPFRCR